MFFANKVPWIRSLFNFERRVTATYLPVRAYREYLLLSLYLYVIV